MLRSVSGVMQCLRAWHQSPQAVAAEGYRLPGALQHWNLDCLFSPEPLGSRTASSSTAAHAPAPTPSAAMPDGIGAGAPAAAEQPGTSSTPVPTSQQPPQRGPMSYGPRLVQPLRSRGPGAVTKQEGFVHVTNSLNNTIMVLTDKGGAVKTWTSAGSVGYKNAGKASPIAAEAAAAELARRAVAKGFYSVVVKLNGAGQNKQFVVQSLAANGLHVTQLQEVTALPHNGCRKPRRRRV